MQDPDPLRQAFEIWARGLDCGVEHWVTENQGEKTLQGVHAYLGWLPGNPEFNDACCWTESGLFSIVLNAPIGEGPNRLDAIARCILDDARCRTKPARKLRFSIDGKVHLIDLSNGGTLPRRSSAQVSGHHYVATVFIPYSYRRCYC